MKKKNIAAVVLAAVVAASVPMTGAMNSALSVTANAEEVVSGNYTYEENDDGTITIIGYDGEDTELVIPDTIDGKKVTAIGEWAFSQRTSLTSVTIPNGVTSIGSLAFAQCTSLTEVKIPDSVTSIGKDAFHCCTSLTAINVDEKNTYFCSENGNLFNKDKTELIQYPAGKTNKSYTIPDSVTSIGESAFERCTSLTAVTIPDSVTSIGKSAFSICTSLTEVTISSSVTSIGYGAFFECKSLIEVTIPSSVTEIGGWAFSFCESLTEVTIPDSVTSIGDRVFMNCPSLKEINIDEKNANYCSENGVLFNKVKTELIQYPVGKNDKIYTIPNSVTSIGYGAFSPAAWNANNNQKSIDISPSGSTNLTAIIIPDSVTRIDSTAFYDCTSLKDVYYSGTEEQWAAISIGYDNAPLKNATIHYESTGPETNDPEPKVFEPVIDEKELEDLDEETAETVKGIVVEDEDGAFDDDVEMNISDIEKTDTDFSFDITFTDSDGNEVQPKDGKKVTVKVPLPEFLKNLTFYLYHFNINGKATSVKFEIKNGFVIFEAESFSKYVLSTTKLDDDVLPGGSDDLGTGEGSGNDNQNTGIALAIAPVALAAGFVIVSAKKRK